MPSSRELGPARAMRPARGHAYADNANQEEVDELKVVPHLRCVVDHLNLDDAHRPERIDQLATPAAASLPSPQPMVRNALRLGAARRPPPPSHRTPLQLLDRRGGRLSVP